MSRYVMAIDSGRCINCKACIVACQQRNKVPGGKSRNWVRELDDESRKSGDTGIIQNTGSSTKGWHVMYYVADNAPVWEQNADNALRSADYTAWEAEQVKGYEAVDGFGLKFV